MQQPNSPLERLLSMNWIILICIFALATIGILMQYSAAGGAMSPWANSQLARFAIGIFLMLVMTILPLSFFARAAYPLYFIGVALLIAVQLVGSVGMGAQRWLTIGPINIQPSEFMKLAVILALARYFHFRRPSDINHPLILLPPIIMLLLPVGLIFLQPNLGTATITMFIGVVIAFMAGIRWIYFGAAGAAALAALPIGWQFLHEYQKKRVMTFLDPTADPLGDGYNIMQSMIAIGSGGFWGKGYLNGSQSQLDFLPEKQTDFIFTMIAEELGFVGASIVLLLFACIMGYALALTTRPRNRFAALIAAGIAALLFAHIFINIGMVMGILPVVGVPLPFLSYGGTFMLSTMMAMGLLMNVYVHRDSALNRNIKALI